MKLTKMYMYIDHFIHDPLIATLKPESAEVLQQLLMLDKFYFKGYTKCLLLGVLPPVLLQSTTCVTLTH